MKTVLFFLNLVFAAALWGQVSVPLTIQEALYPGDMTGHTDTIPSGGIARTNEPFTLGVPLANSAGINSINVLGLTGASAGQFRVLQCWSGAPTGSPATSCSSGGAIKWVEVSGILPSLSAGGTGTVTLTSTGSGNFGGANLATDGAPIVVSTNGGSCGSGTAICFDVKKANHNGIDRVRIGGTTIVASGTSEGIVVTGPSIFSYPDNVTCSPDSSNHPGVSSLCTTAFKSSNDPASTCSIEENGPVKAVLRCDGDLNDGAAHVYMHHTTRYTFYQGKSQAKVVAILRNADYGTDNTFPTAFKGHKGFEFRVKTNISGALNYQIAKNSGTQTGSLSGAQSVYIYQGQSLSMKNANWCTGVASCIPQTPDTGWSIVSSAGGTLATGTTSQFATGWADISDGSSGGVESGTYQRAATESKSLEFLAGGSDVRVGLLSSRNTVPYYQAWPQYDIQEAWLSFHTSAPSSLSDEFLKYQHYLVGRAPRSHYNSTSVFPYPLADPSVEDAWYLATAAAATPAISASNACDGNYPSTPCLRDVGVGGGPAMRIYKWWAWSNSGDSTQGEFRMSKLFNFITRGETGRFLDAAHFYRFEAATSYPLSNYGAPTGAYAWRSKPYNGQVGAALTGSGFPAWASANSPQTPTTFTITAVSNTTPIVVTATNTLAVGQWVSIGGTGLCIDAGQGNGPGGSGSYWRVSAATGSQFTLDSSTGCGSSSSGTAKLFLTSRNWIEESLEHSHGYGILDYYSMTGDETIKDMIMSGMKDILTNPNTYAAGASPQSFGGAVGTTNSRSTGVYLMSTARLATFLGSLNDPDAAQTLANGVSDYASNIKPDMCVSGYPAGCSPLITDPDGATRLSRGVNRKRGVRWGAGSEGEIGGSWCGASPTVNRTVVPFQTAIAIQGLLELRAAKGSAWPDYWTALDLAYGMARGVLTEDYTDDGSGRWDRVGFRANSSAYWSLDAPNNCFSGMTTQATVWSLFMPLQLTEGGTAWQSQMKTLWQALLGASGTSAADYGAYQTGAVVDAITNASAKTLQSLTISSFVNNGGGSYTIGWTTPANTDYVRVKYAPNAIVDWIGFNNQTNTFTGSASTTTNWFAATNAIGVPSPVAGPQSMTITGLPAGLVASSFSVKAMAGAGGGGESPANLVSFAGNGQSGTVGQQLASPLVVRVTSLSGTPVAGVPVLFAVTLGGGSLSVAQTMTDGQGLASTALTLGAVAGTNLVTAVSGTLSGSPVLFTLTARASGPGPAMSLVNVSGNGQSGTVGQQLGTSFVVRATAADNTPVAGVNVTFAVISGGGSLSATQVITDGQGLASSRLTLGSVAGANSVTASSSGLSGSPVLFTATGTVASLGQITWRKSGVPLNPPHAPQWETIRYDPVGQVIIIYQSDNDSIYSNGFWNFKSSSETITKLGSSGTTSQTCPPDTDTWPGDRHPVGQTAIDTRRNVLWLAGGVCGGTSRTDTYQLRLNPNPANNTWRLLTPAHFPDDTRYNTLVYDKDDDVLVSFGYDGGAGTDDTSIYCPTDLNPTPGTLTANQVMAGCQRADDWNIVSTTIVGSARPYSKFVALFYDSPSKKVLMVGGATPVETWTYEVRVRTWTNLAPANPPPPPSTDLHTAVALAYNEQSGLFYYHDSGTPSDWTYNYQTNTWTSLGNLGGPTDSETIAYDPTINALISWNKDPNSYGAGEIWIGQFSGSSTAPTCDLNHDNAVNILDVQLGIGQSLALTACQSGDLNGDGICNVVDIQRLVNASLGQACRIGQ